MQELRQGEVWLVHFHEGWERPSIVVSRNQLNRGELILVVPCTSSEVARRRVFPNQVFLPQGEAGLATDSVAQTHLVQPAHVSWFMQRLGALAPEDLGEVLRSIAWVIDFFDTAEPPPA